MKERKNKTKYIVVAGYEDDQGRQSYIQCLGVFKRYREAYGEALIFLSEIASAQPDEGFMIIPPMGLEGQTGVGMWLKDKNGRSVDYAFVLFNREDEDEKNNVQCTG